MVLDQSRDPWTGHLARTLSGFVHCTYTYSAGNPGNLRSGFGGGSFRSRDRHLLFAMMFGGGGGGGMSDY